MMTQQQIDDLKSRMTLNPNKHQEVIYNGCRRRIFYNAQRGLFGMFNRNSHSNGTIFNDFEGIERVVEKKVQSQEECNRKLIEKFKKYATTATFSNNFIEDIQKADPNKSPYENNLTEGTPIDGKIISLNSFGKHYPWIADQFRTALKERKDYSSPRVPFRGYDCSIALWHDGKGYIHGSLSLEFKGCGNGYYYILVNDENFIGYSID